MIHALHLLWIVPLSATVGFFFAAAFAVGKQSDELFLEKEDETWEQSQLR